MPSSEFDVASQALGLLRANAISSFSDGTNESDTASLYYGDFVKDIFGRYPWTFSLQKEKLNQDATAPVNEWQYRHILPAKVETVWAAYNSGQIGAKPFKNWDTLGKYIYSNEPEIWAEFTVYVPETQWPSYFSHYAIHAFAALIAMPITDDEKTALRIQEMAYGPPAAKEQGGKFAVAAHIDAKRKPPEVFQANRLIAARFS